MRSKFLRSIKYLFLGLLVGSTTFSSSIELSYAASQDVEIDYSSSKWSENGGSLWSVDNDAKTFMYDVDNTNANTYHTNYFVTEQGNLYGATRVEMSATFVASRTSEELEENNWECNIGLIPWYVDENNWFAVYMNFKKFETDPEMNWHIVSVEVYAKIDGSVFTDYYIYGVAGMNSWNPNGKTEWHTTWSDGITNGKDPSSLKENMYEPTDELTLYVRRTRKEIAGRTADSYYVLVNDYELNFGRDNYCFDAAAKKEEENPNLKPKFGLYASNTNKLTVSNLSVSVSYDKFLPVPTVDPLSTPVKSGSVGKSVKIPTFNAMDDGGSVINYTVTVLDPTGKSLYLESQEYFVPEVEGNYTVLVEATDSKGMTGTYSYYVKVKSNARHIDNDVYNDVYTKTPYDNSIDIATVIFIAIPVLIAGYIALRVVLYYKKASKEKRMLIDDEDDE